MPTPTGRSDRPASSTPADIRPSFRLLITTQPNPRPWHGRRDRSFQCAAQLAFDESRQGTPSGRDRRRLRRVAAAGDLTPFGLLSGNHGRRADGIPPMTLLQSGNGAARRAWQQTQKSTKGEQAGNRPRARASRWLPVRGTRSQAFPYSRRANSIDLAQACKEIRQPASNAANRSASCAREGDSQWHRPNLVSSSSAAASPAPR